MKVVSHELGVILYVFSGAHEFNAVHDACAQQWAAQSVYIWYEHRGARALKWDQKNKKFCIAGLYGLMR